MTAPTYHLMFTDDGDVLGVRCESPAMLADQLAMFLAIDAHLEEVAPDALGDEIGPWLLAEDDGGDLRSLTAEETDAVLTGLRAERARLAEWTAAAKPPPLSGGVREQLRQAIERDPEEAARAVRALRHRV